MIAFWEAIAIWGSDYLNDMADFLLYVNNAAGVNSKEEATELNSSEFMSTDLTFAARTGLNLKEIEDLSKDAYFKLLQ